MEKAQGHSFSEGSLPGTSDTVIRAIRAVMKATRAAMKAIRAAESTITRTSRPFALRNEVLDGSHKKRSFPIALCFPIAQCVLSGPFSLGLVLFALGLGLSGCEEKGRFFGKTSPPRPANELTLNLGSEPEYIDPGLASESSGGFVIRNVFAGLVQVHPQSLQPMPDIARRWEVSEDQRVYTFYLRESAWSDGRPVTAEDFEWSWKRLLDPTTGSKYASFAYSIQNGAAFNRKAVRITGLPAGTTTEQVEEALGEAIAIESVEATDWPNRSFFVFIGGEDEDKSENRERAVEQWNESQLLGHKVRAEITGRDAVAVRALDAGRLEVRLKNPLPFFLDQLCFYSLRPVPRHVIERLEREGTNPALWTRVENWVSNGPYMLTEHRFRQYYRLEKNPHYWAAGDVAIDRVNLPLVENTNTVLNLYRTADLDWIGQNSVLPNEFMTILRKYDDVRRSPYLGVYWFWANVNRAPLDNIKVRRALYLSIDRESLVEHVTQGGQLPMAGLVPEGLAGYEAPDFPLFDPDRAREILAEAGFPGGEGLAPITLSYNTSEGHKQIAVAIQQMWKEHLGVEVTIENQEWKVYLKNLKSHNYQLGRMGWIGDYADPYTFLEVLSQHNGNNHSGWKNDTYDALLERANTIANPTERMRVLREAEELVIAELPILPIYVYARIDIVKPYLRGYWRNLQNVHPIKWMSVDERFRNGAPANWEPEDPPPEPIAFLFTAEERAAIAAAEEAAAEAAAALENDTDSVVGTGQKD